MSAASRKRVLILGSTGSIGTSALKVARDLPDRMEIVGMAAATSADLLAQQFNVQGAIGFGYEPRRCHDHVYLGCHHRTHKKAQRSIVIHPGLDHRSHEYFRSHLACLGNAASEFIAHVIRVTRGKRREIHNDLEFVRTILKCPPPC